jgi:hypothetical protein
MAAAPPSAPWATAARRSPHRRLHPGDPGPSGVQQVDVVGRARWPRRGGCAAPPAGRSRSSTRQPARCQAQLSAAVKPPCALRPARSASAGSGRSRRSRRRRRAGRPAWVEGACHVGLQVVEHQRRRHGQAQRIGAAWQRHCGVRRPAPRAAARRRARLRVMAQAVSSVLDSGMQPSSGVRRWVFLKPTRPCSAAGMRIEPPVSDPSAAQAAPVATDGAARGGAARHARRRVSAAVPGWTGVPWCGLMPTPEYANSDRLVWPTSAAPAARSRATAGQSPAAGSASASDAEPPWLAARRRRTGP